MAIVKESSDELNPSETVPEPGFVRPKPDRSIKDYLALAIATCGVGYLPLAPGTWGSLVAVGGYLLFRSTIQPQPPNNVPRLSGIAFIGIQLVVILILTLLGTWAASRTERVLGLKDPGKVVVDEVAGQLIALLPLPLIVNGSSLAWALLAFILFRFFDIVKPYPARKFEALHGGLGIMADDLAAGVYAAVLVGLAVALF